MKMNQKKVGLIAAALMMSLAATTGFAQGNPNQDAHAVSTTAAKHHKAHAHKTAAKKTPARKAHHKKSTKKKSSAAHAQSVRPVGSPPPGPVRNK
jgi:hypothetical protein